MPRLYQPHVPQDVGELLDHLTSMLGGAPIFEDKSGYFFGKSIDTEFLALNEGLRNVRGKVGEERYAALLELSNRIRALFEADPEDKTGETHQGCLLIHEMEELLKKRQAKA